MSEQIKTPITDNAAWTTATGDRVVFYGEAVQIERQLAAERQLRERAEADAAVMRQALEEIKSSNDAPDIDVGGEYQVGLHCGVEDRACSDRYEGADYGWSRGVERTLEWAHNIAESALSTTAGAELLERLRTMEQNVKDVYAINQTLLTERDSLRAEVERLREDVKQRREVSEPAKTWPRIRDLPESEREPFSNWLVGQTVPWIEGEPASEQDAYYRHDYENWKRGGPILD